MVLLNISVGFANVLLWAFIEIFLLLVSNAATYQIARYSVNKRLANGDSITFNSNRDFIDTLPYNNDLHLVPKRTKLTLTFYRLLVIILSVYIGASLDGERKIDPHNMQVTSALSLATNSTNLIVNTGDDMNAMGKLSCLQIRDNNHIVLYKAYVANNQPIICEDGNNTISSAVILEAEIRSEDKTPSQGLNISNFPISESKFSEKSAKITRNITKHAINIELQDDKSAQDKIQVRIVLIKKLNNGNCKFGLWRSSGLGFKIPLDVKIYTSCSVQIVALERMLKEKPDFLPPRMSFLYQIIDATVVSLNVTKAPKLREQDIVASIPMKALLIAAIAALVSTIAVIIFTIMIRKAKLFPDLAYGWGVAAVMNENSSRWTDENELEFQWNEDRRGVLVRQRSSNSYDNSNERNFEDYVYTRE